MRDERTPKDVRGEAISQLVSFAAVIRVVTRHATAAKETISQCENSEVQIAAFSKCTMYKDSFFVYVQPCVNENL